MFNSRYITIHPNESGLYELQEIRKKDQFEINDLLYLIDLEKFSSHHSLKAASILLPKNNHIQAIYPPSYQQADCYRIDLVDEFGNIDNIALKFNGLTDELNELTSINDGNILTLSDIESNLQSDSIEDDYDLGTNLKPYFKINKQQGYDCVLIGKKNDLTLNYLNKKYFKARPTEGVNSQDDVVQPDLSFGNLREVLPQNGPKRVITLADNEAKEVLSNLSVNYFAKSQELINPDETWSTCRPLYLRPENFTCSEYSLLFKAFSFYPEYSKYYAGRDWELLSEGLRNTADHFHSERDDASIPLSDVVDLSEYELLSGSKGAEEILVSNRGREESHENSLSDLVLEQLESDESESLLEEYDVVSTNSQGPSKADGLSHASDSSSWMEIETVSSRIIDEEEFLIVD